MRRRVQGLLGRITTSPSRCAVSETLYPMQVLLIFTTLTLALVAWGLPQSASTANEAAPESSSESSTHINQSCHSQLALLIARIV